MSKDILGRNIVDLIDENKIKLKDNEEILEVQLSDIKPNPDQPRVNFDSQALKQLSESIKEHGVIQPVILKPASDGFTLVAGERRVRASILANKKTIPAIVRDYNAIYLAELSILENIQREDLTPIEEAIAYEKAIKKLSLTQAELGQKIGKSRSYVTNAIGLLNLPIGVIEEVNSGVISRGHAKILSKLDNVELINELASKIKHDQISVRKLEDIMKRKTKESKKNSIKENMENHLLLERITHDLKILFGGQNNIKVSSNEIKVKFRDLKSMQETIDRVMNKK